MYFLWIYFSDDENEENELNESGKFLKNEQEQIQIKSSNDKTDSEALDSKSTDEIALVDQRKISWDLLF